MALPPGGIRTIGAAKIRTSPDVRSRLLTALISGTANGPVNNWKTGGCCLSSDTSRVLKTRCDEKRSESEYPAPWIYVGSKGSVYFLCTSPGLLSKRKPADGTRCNAVWPKHWQRFHPKGRVEDVSRGIHSRFPRPSAQGI